MTARLELKDLESYFEYDGWFLPGHLIRLTLPGRRVFRYWNPSVGMSALKNPGGVTVEILAFAEEAV